MAKVTAAVATWHDDIAQRALTAGRLANLSHGQRADLLEARDVPGHVLPLLGDVTPPAAPVAPITFARAAELMDVSPASVARAKVVLAAHRRPFQSPALLS